MRSYEWQQLTGLFDRLETLSDFETSCCLDRYMMLNESSEPLAGIRALSRRIGEPE
jgi:hypothetical protein